MEEHPHRRERGYPFPYLELFQYNSEAAFTPAPEPLLLSEDAIVVEVRENKRALSRSLSLFHEDASSLKDAEFWTTAEARTRCLRIASKIGGTSRAVCRSISWISSKIRLSISRFFWARECFIDSGFPWSGSFTFFSFGTPLPPSEPLPLSS